MAPLALVLHLSLSLASPGLVPPRDPGPLQGSEVAAASLGVLTGDALVAGTGYLTLQLFARGAITPSAANFRSAAYALGATALLLPPVTAALLARWARAEPASGALWKAMLLAVAGQAAALAAGYAAAPHFWVVIPVQLLAIGLGTSLGLHWGPRTPAAAAGGRHEPHPAEEPADPPPTAFRPAQCTIG